MAGYLLTKKHLLENDLNVLKVNISIPRICGSDRNQCIRGSTAFGSIMERNNLGVVIPSMKNPQPAINTTFFEGGYITSNYIGDIDAIQTELPPFLTSTSSRRTHAKNYAAAIVDYMQANNFLRSSITSD